MCEREGEREREKRREKDLSAPVDVLHGFELIEILCCSHVASIDLVDRLPKEVGRYEIIGSHDQFHLRREEPPAQRQARRRRCAVVLDVDVVRNLVHLQFPFCWQFQIKFY